MMRPLHFWLLLPALLAGALPLCAQTPQDDWEGKVVAELREEGWHRNRFKSYKDQMQLRKGQPYDKAKRDADLQLLFATSYFEDVDIQVAIVNGQLVVTVRVKEYEVINDVIVSGVINIPIATIRPGLRLNSGDMLNPARLKADEDYLRETFLLKGYYFFSVTPEIEHVKEGGVILHWQVTEGPLVTVRELRLTGCSEKDAKEVRDRLLTRGAGTTLGFIPTGGEAFLQHNLEEDLKRIRLHFHLDGWLDIGKEDNVFVSDLEFSRDKSEVTIVVHVDLGRRYRLTKVSFSGNTVFPEEQLKKVMKSKEGGDYSDNNTRDDMAKLREMYGERAYIMTEVTPSWVVDQDKPEGALTYTIVEGQEVTVGKIVLQGNSKTRYDVILRELKDFSPGDKFNEKLLNRGISNLRDRGYFDQQGGIQIHTEPGSAPSERDVVIDVKEGTTGSIRFAGGFSSSFGILGILEFTQRNFDIADLPKDMEDLFSGNAFAGGGQFLRLRAQPAAKRQSYLAEFREPYVFGNEFGFGVRGMSITTNYRDYDERRLEGILSLDKRIGRVSTELKFDARRVAIVKIDLGSPPDVFEVEGINYLYSITPGLAIDTRDSWVAPTQGFRLGASYEYAGGVLSGDWSFGKFYLGSEYHVPLLETDDRQRHVLSFRFTFGWSVPFRQNDDLPIFERFFAGGRESVRGFEFRGVGPHTNGIPVGGNVLIAGTAEYTFPIFGEFLRGALFYDVGNLAQSINRLGDDKFRNAVGFGIRFNIPQLGNIPVALDFGFPMTREPFDERQTVTFDIGKLF